LEIREQSIDAKKAADFPRSNSGRLDGRSVVGGDDGILGCRLCFRFLRNARSLGVVIL